MQYLSGKCIVHAMYIYTYHLTFRQDIFDVGACKLINYILILAVE